MLCDLGLLGNGEVNADPDGGAGSRWAGTKFLLTEG